MKMNLKVPISKNGTVGEMGSKAGMIRVGIMISMGGMIKVGTESIKIGPNLKKDVSLTMRIGSMTFTLEMTMPEAEA